MSQVLEYLNQKGIVYKLSGTEAIIRCPNCGKEKLSININTSLYQCFVCQASDKSSIFAKGHLHSLQEFYGDIISISPIIPSDSKPTANFSLLVERYHHDILSNKKALKYLFGRGINIESIKRFKLGVVLSKSQWWISIPAFKGEVPVFIKYRKLPPDERSDLEKCEREVGGESILFNYNCIDGNNELYITEGELDAITLIQQGYENVVGTTVGAGTLKSDWYDQLILKDKLILAFDSDAAGQKSAREVWATRLGISKCWNLEYPPGEDTNSYFQTHTKGDFAELVKGAKQFKVAGIKSTLDVLLEMYRRSQTNYEEVFELPWPSVNRLIGGGFKRGRLITLGAPPATGKCVKWDTNIIDTKYGNLYTIKDFINMKNSFIYNKEISSISSPNNKFSKEFISEYVDSGLQKCFRVETELGNYIECPDHNKLLTINGWKKISELSVGDKIAVPKKINILGTDFLDQDVARLLGYIITEGCTINKTRTISFSSTEKDLIDDLKNICIKFDSELKIQGKSTNKDFRITRLHRNNTASGIYNLIKYFGLINKYSYEKFIPQQIFSSTKETIQNFIYALWSCDGWVCNRRVGKKTSKEIGYSSSSFKLAQQVQHLLLRFGIVTRLRKKKTYRRDNYIVYCNSYTDIKLFHDNFKLCSRKQKKLDKIIKLGYINKQSRNIDLIDKKYWKVVIEELRKHKISIPKIYKEYKPNRKGRKCPNYTRPVYRDFLKLAIDKTNSDILKDILYSDVGFVKIKSINNIGIHQTYDLSVPTTKCFIANDILIHNTSFAMQICHHFAVKYNLASLFFCLEMSEIELMMKVLQLHFDLNYTEVNYSDAMLYLPQLENFPLYFGYSSKVTPDIFYNTAQEVRNRYDVQFCVFDNLQRMIRTGEESDMARASSVFKDISLNLNIPMLLISQPRKMDNKTEITYDDLKGTSAIGADADEIILMMRRRIREATSTNESLEPKTRIIIDKSRFSAGGTTYLEMLGSKSRFIEWTKN